MNTKMVAGGAIVLAVIAVPLLLKSRPVKPDPAHSSVAATSRQVQRLPRFVDIGTTTCIPCKAMLGVMAELEQKYPGAMAVEFVNVHDDPDAMARFGVKVIPSQIFYDPQGRELFRHTGVMRADAIIAKWAELGFRMTPTPGG